MMRCIALDAIKIHYPIPSGQLGFFISQLIDLAKFHKGKMKSVQQDMTYGRTAILKIDGQELQITALKCCKSEWIGYRFKGLINVDAFESATVLLGEWSFRNALLMGSVKKLELAIDYQGLHTSQFVIHYKGMKTSNVICNSEATGSTYYSGSRNGKTQMVVYDKAQEIRDRGGVPFCGNLLRAELRIQNRKESFPEVIQEIFDFDPFRDFYIVDKIAALGEKTKIKEWPIFLSTCSMLGTAGALRQFPQHKKSFLELLKKLSIAKLTPSIFDFEKSFCWLLKSAA